MLPERKDIRLKSYDYSEAGLYCITICTNGRANILGHIEPVGGDPLGAPQVCIRGIPVGGDPLGAPPHSGDPWEYSIDMPYTQLTNIGKIVLNNIEYIQNHTKNFGVDCFCIMPNHVHLVIEKLALSQLSGAPNGSPPTGIRSIPQLISSFKRFSNQQTGISLWQRNYYEHIIRDEKDLSEIRKYILENPLRWTLDKYYSE